MKRRLIKSPPLLNNLPDDCTIHILTFLPKMEISRQIFIVFPQYSRTLLEFKTRCLGIIDKDRCFWCGPIDKQNLFSVWLETVNPKSEETQKENYSKLVDHIEEINKDEGLKLCKYYARRKHVKACESCRLICSRCNQVMANIHEEKFQFCNYCKKPFCYKCSIMCTFNGSCDHRCCVAGCCVYYVAEHWEDYICKRCERDIEEET